MSATAIIVAAGAGRRLGGNTPKTFVSLGGRPMLLHTIDRFLAAPSIEKLIIVVAPEELARARMLLEQDAAVKQKHRWQLQGGGLTRQESVRRGLELTGPGDEIIAIHDGARPFVTPTLIERCVAAVREKGAVVVGLPARDTIKEVSGDGWVKSTLQRESLWQIQTPQAFMRDTITAAHRWAVAAGIEATDDAALVEKHGGRVFVLEGERTNFKVTIPDDIWLAETMIRQGLVPQKQGGRQGEGETRR
jgi:2-C-methyl-D-erythritol 4-phosphate cytidylyltransferase